MGLLYIASTTVYNSIIAVCIILGNVSYAIPAVLLMLNGRKMNPNRWLKLGLLGWISNIVTIGWTIFTTVMWLFPLTPHPTGETMSNHAVRIGLMIDYSVAVLGGMAILAILDWGFYARKHYSGPNETDLAEQ